jgi:hypothetical protein
MMPTLLDTQNAFMRSLLAHDDAQAAVQIIADGLPSEARLNIYRNTFVATLTTALRLSYPAVHQLVGVEFFESAARVFIEATAPESAYLNEYGATFPDFLAGFPPADSVPYLSDVARLEWAVNRALHADDAPAINLGRLSTIAPEDQNRIVFVPHPAVSLVQSPYPIDDIWRAVLAKDDEAIASIDLTSDPVRLLVHRRDSGIEVIRASEPTWRFAVALFSSKPLQAAFDAAGDLDPSVLLGDHLAAGRLIDFRVLDESMTSMLEKLS